MRTTVPYSWTIQFSLAAVLIACFLTRRWVRGDEVIASAEIIVGSCENYGGIGESCRATAPDSILSTITPEEIKSMNTVMPTSNMPLDENLESVDEREGEKEFEEMGDDDVGPGIDYGVAQTIQDRVDENEFWMWIDQTAKYIQDFAETHDFFVKIRGECFNSHESCTTWAMEGECDANHNYMLSKEGCRPACRACPIPPQGPGSDFGVVQWIEARDEHDSGVPVRVEDVQDALEETAKYFKETIMADDFYTKVRKLCFNKHENCTIWAAQGECEEGMDDYDFMNENCPVSCGRCDRLHYETRCPIDPDEFPNVWEPGDLNRMFERVVADPQYQTTVWSRPSYGKGDTNETANYLLGPWIITIDNFISEEEAAHLIKWGNDMGYERSEEVGGIDSDTGEPLESQISEDRTSTNSWCTGECDSDALVTRIFERIEEMTGVPPENSESLQMLKYEPDQFYLTHSDYAPNSHMDQGGPRILTVFMYLSDVEEGGETRFAYFGDELLVKPKVGRVAVWPSVLDEDPSQKETRTEHEAMRVIRGQKFAANAWLHLRDYTRALANGC